MKDRLGKGDADTGSSSSSSKKSQLSSSLFSLEDATVTSARAMPLLRTAPASVLSGLCFCSWTELVAVYLSWL
uniref:Uncharacterized protein n=1 Tax=Oryza brachyantha TaxID=4533 RepID=J3M3N8_ORYBR